MDQLLHYGLLIARGAVSGDKTMIRLLVVVLVSTGGPVLAVAQPAPPRLPVIDLHVHSTNTTPEDALSRMKSLNIRFLLVAGLAPDLPKWVAALRAEQFLPALAFPCPGGRAPFVDRRCWDGVQELPNVYVDLGALQATFMVPRPSYYAYLKGLVDNGFAGRIVFGSDFPNQVASGIDAIMGADFLSHAQKADILCDNAARFLRLDTSICVP